MTLRHLRLPLLAWAALALVTTACRDRETSGAPSRLAPPSRSVARLAFSSLDARAGDEVVARLSVQLAPGVAAVGSYTAQVAYDTTALALVAELPAEGDVVQVVNPLPGVLRAAGIAPSGFREGELVALRFRARRDGAIRDAMATLTELHGTDRADLLGRLASPRVSAQQEDR